MAARHRFVLDTRRLVTVLIGLLLVGGLLFTGGFLAGMRRQLMKPQTSSVALDPAPGERSATLARAELPLPSAKSAAKPPTAPAAPLLTVPAAPVRPSPPPETLRATRPAAAAIIPIDNSGEPAADTRLTPPTIYELQLGLYLRQLDAETSIQQLAELGYEAYTVPVSNSRGELLYTVRLGPFESMDAAGAAAREFTAVEKQPAIIRFRRQPVELSAPPTEVPATLPEQPATPAAGS